MSYLKLLHENRTSFSKGLPEGTGQNGGPMEAEISRAMRLLNLAGCRIIRQDSGFLVGIWEDLDDPELRAAICALGMNEHPIVHLESPEIAIQYKIRHCPERHTGESFSSWFWRAEAAHRRLLPAGREF